MLIELTELTVLQAGLLGAAIALFFAFLIIAAVLIVFYYKNKQELATYEVTEESKVNGKRAKKQGGIPSPSLSSNVPPPPPPPPPPPNLTRPVNAASGPKPSKPTEKDSATPSKPRPATPGLGEVRGNLISEIQTGVAGLRKTGGLESLLNKG